MSDYLFTDKRDHPKFYNVEVHGKRERTVSIRGGISWPGVNSPGYFVLVAQLEETTARKDKKPRLLCFEECQALLIPDLFEKIAKACGDYRIDGLCCGDEPGDLEFSCQLDDYLQALRDGPGGEIVQRPVNGKSFRAGQPDFLVQLLKSYLATKHLPFLSISDGRTPLLIDRIKNADLEADILEIPEIKALCYVLDDYDISPWTPPPPFKKDKGSNWAV